MSSKGSWFLWKALATLILIGVIAAGGLAVHHLAWSSGYTAGQLAAEGAEVTTPPYLPHGFAPARSSWGLSPLAFGVGVLFKIVLALVFLGLICKLIRFLVWGPVFHHAMAGPWAKHWHRGHWRRAARWHPMHGPVPPWCWDWDESGEEEAEGASDAGE